MSDPTTTGTISVVNQTLPTAALTTAEFAYVLDASGVNDAPNVIVKIWADADWYYTGVTTGGYKAHVPAGQPYGVLVVSGKIITIYMSAVTTANISAARVK